MNQKVKVLLKLSISLALTGLLIWMSDPQQLWDNLTSLPLWFVFFAWGYYSLCQLISAWRWQMFLTARDIHVPIKSLFSFYMVGMFLNNFMPGAVGGDVVKGYDLYRYTGKGHIAAASVFMERFTGLIGLSLISMAALGFGFRYISSPVILLAVAGTAVVLGGMVAAFWFPPISRLVRRILAMLPGKLEHHATELFDSLEIYRHYRKAMTGAIILSVLVQLLFSLYYSLAGWAMGFDIHPVYFVLFLPLITLVTMVPISIGGLGVREGMMILLFESVGIAGSDILAVSLTIHLINTVLSLWGGIILMLRKPAERRGSDPAAEVGNA